MSESSKKTTRRRRRRSRSRKPKSERHLAPAEVQAAEPSTTASKRSRRRRSRRGKTDVESPATEPSGRAAALLHEYDSASLEVSPINPDIFIYTYTLRPRSLLDNYQAGPGVAERMEFENGGSSSTGQEDAGES